MSQGRSGGKNQTGNTGGYGCCLFLLSIFILIIGGGAWIVLDQSGYDTLNHLSRILALPSVAAFGSWFGDRLTRRAVRWQRVLARAAGGLLLFILAWAFVPTWSGTSPALALVGAERLAAELRSLPATDLAHAQGIIIQEFAKLNARKFPSIAWWAERRIDAAGLAWGQKVAQEFESAVRELPPDEIGPYSRLKRDPRLPLVNRWPGPAGRIRHAQEVWEDAAAVRIAPRFAAVSLGDFSAFDAVAVRAEALRAAAGRTPGLLQEALSTWGQRTADEQARPLETLAPGDLAGYEAGRAARDALVQRFPELREEVRRAELAWGKRAVEEQARRLEALALGDFAGYEAGRAARETLIQQHFPDHEIRGAEAAWGGRTVEALAVEIGPLLGSDPGAAIERLRAPAATFARWDEQTRGRPHRAAQTKLLELRKRALLSGLDRAKADARELIRQERFARAAESTASFRERWGEEAKNVEMQADLDHLAESYAFLADLARLAKKPDPQ